MEVHPSQSIPSVGLGDGVATREHGERRVNIVPQKEPHFLPPICRSGNGELEVEIDSMPRFDIGVYAIQNHRFRARA
jgi:hypothetical protein